MDLVEAALVDPLAVLDRGRVRIEHDPDADAVYIHLTDAELAPGRDTVTVDSPEGADGDVLLDWKAGRLVGIEVLGAGAVLHPDLLAAATPPGESRRRS